MDADELDHRDRLQRALGDDFALAELIGRGGFGHVYAARDRRLDRDVAVKTLRHDLFPTRAVLDRFTREARAVAKLRHPNILPIYSVGEGEGIAFMIMPLIRGESLASALDRLGALAPSDAARIAADVGRALDAAHRVGIVHRDVKPENILLEGDERHVLLGDFGIARDADSETAITGTGIVVGSPQYMSPEQASGDRDIDSRSDVYSLAAVAYEMLAGRPPYVAGNFQQLLVKRFTTDPLPLAQVTRDVDAAVSDAVMRGLARNREERWSSAGEFASALIAGSGITPPAVWGEDVLEGTWLERRGPLLIGLSLTLFYLGIAEAVLATAGNRAAVTIIRPIVDLLQIGIPFFLAEMLARLTMTRMSGASWISALRKVLGQPRWWQSWYPRALRHPSNVWDRMPASIKTLRTILAIDILAIPLVLPLVYFVPHLTAVAEGSGYALPMLMRFVIGTSDALGRLLPASVLALVGGVLAVSIARKISAVRVVECLLTWRRDRWTATEARRLLTTSAA